MEAVYMEINLNCLARVDTRKKKEITQVLILLKASLTDICFAQLFFDWYELNQSYLSYHQSRGKLEVLKMWVIPLAVNSSYINSNPYIINIVRVCIDSTNGTTGYDFLFIHQ